jgi:hypothetical protein
MTVKRVRVCEKILLRQRIGHDTVRNGVDRQLAVIRYRGIEVDFTASSRCDGIERLRRLPIDRVAVTVGLAVFPSAPDPVQVLAQGCRCVRDSLFGRANPARRQLKAPFGGCTVPTTGRNQGPAIGLFMRALHVATVGGASR